MGILKHLLFWPVTGPAYLARFSMEKVQGVVKEELTDDQRVKEALMDLQLGLELGEVSEEEYVREEARLMARLREIRRWKKEFGMGVRGGVVQMGGEEEDQAGAGGEAEDEERPVTARAAGAEVGVVGFHDDGDEEDDGSTGADTGVEWHETPSEGSEPGSSSS